MLRRNLGLTKLYNLVNDHAVHGDQDVDRLRTVHVEIDEATTAAYGWDDIPLDHGFHSFRQVHRWTICSAARVEALDRLLFENHGRSEGDRGSLPSTPQSSSAAADGTLFS